MIKLRILRWRAYAGLSRWAQCDHKNHYSPYKREAEGQRSEDSMLLVLKIEEGAMSQ